MIGNRYPNSIVASRYKQPGTKSKYSTPRDLNWNPPPPPPLAEDSMVKQLDASNALNREHHTPSLLKLNAFRNLVHGWHQLHQAPVVPLYHLSLVVDEPRPAGIAAYVDGLLHVSGASPLWVKVHVNARKALHIPDLLLGHKWRAEGWNGV